VALLRRLTGRPPVPPAATAAQVDQLRADVASLRDVVLALNHSVGQISAIVQELNHDVRSGAPEAVPLYLGYAERLRLDTDTAVAAAQVIERQIALLTDRTAEATPNG